MYIWHFDYLNEFQIHFCTSRHATEPKIDNKTYRLITCLSHKIHKNHLYGHFDCSAQETPTKAQFPWLDLNSLTADVNLHLKEHGTYILTKHLFVQAKKNEFLTPSIRIYGNHIMNIVFIYALSEDCIRGSTVK